MRFNIGDTVEMYGYPWIVISRFEEMVPMYEMGTLKTHSGVTSTEYNIVLLDDHRKLTVITTKVVEDEISPWAHL